MREGERGGEFRLVPPDCGWATAVLFETPEQIYQRVYRVLKPRSVPPPVEVRFEAFANADSRIVFAEAKLLVRITDLLREAPAPVHEALAFILLGKLLRKPVAKLYSHRYRLFLNRYDMRKRAQSVRRERGYKLHRGPSGQVYDLEPVFEELNGQYFFGLMARPDLGWSQQVSRTRLGHFDPSHNAIVISRIFDRLEVPRLALEYVMFHEMLHLEFPVKLRAGRRCVHPPEFKARERQFARYGEAQELLKKL